MVLQILHHGSDAFTYSELAGEDSDSNEYISGIQDCLAKKATGTINIRAGSVLLYIEWCAARGEAPFP
eukprot:1987798-Amphidinium_carterae.1